MAVETKLKAYILNHNHEAERANYKQVRDFYTQRLP